MSDNKKNGGFASMDKDAVRAIASSGGKAAWAKGRAHHYTPETAREAGKKGGAAISANREHMRAIGRLGGKARGAKKAAVVVAPEVAPAE